MSNSIAFDRAADYYDQTRAVPPEVEAQGVAAIAEALGLEFGARVLEAGVGTGRWAIPLSQHGYRYHGVDLAMPMLHKLVGKQQPDEPPIILTQGDITNLPYRDSSFAGVLVVHVFHLVPQYPKAIAEIRRVLQPGGVVVAVGDNVPHDGDIRNRTEEKLDALLQEQGYKHESAVPPSWQDIQNVASIGATQVDDYTAFTWTLPTTLRAEFDHIAARRWSWLWQIPETAFQPALVELKSWLEGAYDMDAPVERVRDFRITRVRYELKVASCK